MCNFCCKFADPKTAEKFINAQYGVKEILQAGEGDKVYEDDHVAVGDSKATVPVQVMRELMDRPSILELEGSHLQSAIVDGSNSTKCAFQTVADEMEKNKNIAQFVELKMQTEELLQVEGIVIPATGAHHDAAVVTEGSIQQSPRPPASPRAE